MNSTKSLANATNETECYRDKFDSAMLGCEAWKLWLHGPVDAAVIEALVDGAAADVVFCFTIFDHANFRALQKLGFELISLRNTYERATPTTTDTGIAPDGIEFTTASLARQRIRQADLVALADVLGATSRYYKDTHIPKDKSRAVYVAWLNNSLFNGYAAESMLAFQNERLVGVHTIKVKNDSGNKVGIVDLIGIVPDLQNAGLGSALLYAGLEVMRAHGASRIEVTTENENIQGSRFYQKHGFKLASMQLVWHGHKQEKS
jgi:ribosomal protein S18 acetylase RimI-like enzyme